MTCLDASTGKVIYRSRVGAVGAYFASPIAADGRVYLTSLEGVVTVLASDGDQLKVLARNEVGEDVIATPAIAESTIYVRDAPQFIRIQKLIPNKCGLEGTFAWRTHLL